MILTLKRLLCRHDWHPMTGGRFCAKCHKVTR